jgi:hypothetical protein
MGGGTHARSNLRGHHVLTTNAVTCSLSGLGSIIKLFLPRKSCHDPHSRLGRLSDAVSKREKAHSRTERWNCCCYAKPISDRWDGQLLDVVLWCSSVEPDC